MEQGLHLVGTGEFRLQAGALAVLDVQDIRRRVAACFVALAGERSIAGYHTLATASVPLTALPADIARKLPRHAAVPAIRMVRLAVDRVYRGQGLGRALLYDAPRRAARFETAAFYRPYGFIELSESSLALFLPLATVRAAE